MNGFEPMYSHINGTNRSEQFLIEAINNFSFNVFARSKKDLENEKVFNEILELIEKSKKENYIKEKELDFNVSSLSIYKLFR